MNDEEFRALIAELSTELREIGAADVADERFYVQLDEHGQARRLPPAEHLAQMLESFSRYLIVRDRSTYESAINLLQNGVEGRRDSVRGAVVVPVYGSDAHEFDLSSSPNLGEVRQLLSQLRQDLFGSLNRG